MKKLNARQKSFVAHYLIDKNGAKAARFAGCAKGNAAAWASEALTKPHVIAAIEKGQAKAAAAADVTAADVLAELKKLAMVDNTAAFNPDGTLKAFSEMTEANRKSIVGFETEELFAGRGEKRRKVGRAHKIKNADKLRALEMLAKHFKLLTDQIEIGGMGGEPIVHILLPANGREAAGTELQPAPVPAPVKSEEGNGPDVPKEITLDAEGTERPV